MKKTKVNSRLHTFIVIQVFLGIRTRTQISPISDLNFKPDNNHLSLMKTKPFKSIKKWHR